MLPAGELFGHLPRWGGTLSSRRRRLDHVRQPFGGVRDGDGAGGGGHAGEPGRIAQQLLQRAGEAVDGELMLAGDLRAAGVSQQARVLALVVVPGAGLESALDVDLLALGDLLADALSEVRPGDDVEPFGLFSPFVVVAAVVATDGEAELGLSGAAGDVAQLSVAPEVADRLTRDAVTYPEQFGPASRLRTVNGLAAIQIDGTAGRTPVKRG